MPSSTRGEPAPFTLAPLLLEKPWGGHAIEPMLGLAPSGRRIGEAWLCADLASTATSGAGGGAMISVIESGWQAGRTLHEVVAKYPADFSARHLAGSGPASGREASTRFSLLLKLLDAERHLSVQVHPRPAYAATHPDAHVKFEAWYSLRTRGDASFLLGLDGIDTPEALRAAAASETIGERLTRHPVRRGDAVCIPSGVVHALGAGNTVFEVQTPSDTTFRLYDWTKETGEPARQLHLDEACASADLRTPPQFSAAATRQGSAVCATDRFTLHAVQGPSVALKDLANPGHFAVVVPLEHAAELSWGAAEAHAAPAFMATVVPAALLERSVLRLQGTAQALVVTP